MANHFTTKAYYDDDERHSMTRDLYSGRAGANTQEKHKAILTLIKW